MTAPATALALCRFGQDAAATLLWGGSAYLWVFVPPALSARVAAALRAWAGAAVGVAVLAVAAKLPAEVAGIGDGWRDALDPAMVRGVLLDTGVGRAWAAQASCALLLAAAAVLPVRGRTASVALASGLLLASLALDGHFAAREGWPGVLDRADAVVHVLAGGAWLGALVPVSLILARSRTAPQPHEAAAALRGFSRAGHVAVALLLLSGVASTALILGRWPSDLALPYQALLDAKIACTLAMAALAVVNRYVLVPRRTRGAGPLLLIGTLAELPLGLAALALVAVFGLLDPA